MAIIEIIHFNVEQSVDEKIHKTVKAIEGLKVSNKFVVGSQIQDPNEIQITSERDDIQNQASNQFDQNSSVFVDEAQDILGAPQSIFHVALNQAVFGPEGPATANLVEYAQSWFPSSRVTPDFQRQIEEDFLKFDEIFIQESKGHLGLAYGWVLEEQDHKDIEGEKAKSFVIIRGWDKMKDFEKSVQTEAYQKAIPILFGWKAPFKMWHVERKSENPVSRL